MHYYLITGTSKGLGLALAQQLHAAGGFIVGISRTRGPFFAEDGPPERRKFIGLDLSRPTAATDCLQRVTLNLHLEETKSLTLILNAARAEPLGNIGHLDPEELARTVHLNYTAPLQLVNRFVRQYAEYPFPKTIVNISTGVARQPFQGMSAYGSTKAALLHAMNHLATEQQEAVHPVRVVSLSPGVMSTQMVEGIWSSDDKLALQARFDALAARDGIRTPEAAARGVLEVLNNPDVPQNELIRLEDYSSLPAQ